MTTYPPYQFGDEHQLTPSINSPRFILFHFRYPYINIHCYLIPTYLPYQYLYSCHGLYLFTVPLSLFILIFVQFSISINIVYKSISTLLINRTNDIIQFYSIIFVGFYYRLAALYRDSFVLILFYSFLIFLIFSLSDPLFCQYWSHLRHLIILLSQQHDVTPIPPLPSISTLFFPNNTKFLNQKIRKIRKTRKIDSKNPLK
jgi:hypothetical protein